MRQVVAGIVAHQDVVDLAAKGFRKPIEDGSEGVLGVVGDDEHADPWIPRRAALPGRPRLVHARMIATPPNRAERPSLRRQPSSAAQSSARIAGRRQNRSARTHLAHQPRARRVSRFIRSSSCTAV